MERTYVFALQVPGEAGEHTLKVAIYFEGVEVDAKEVKFKAKPFLPTFKSPAELKGLYKAPVRIKSFSISSPVWLSQDPLGVIKVVNEGTIPVSVKLKFSGLEAYWEPSAPIKPGEVKSFEVPFKSAKPGTYTVTATLIWDEHIADTATVTVEVTGAP